MAIKSCRIHHIGPFRPDPANAGTGQISSNQAGHDVQIDLDKQVNLFIGPNNVGKSTILQTLAAVATRFAKVSLPPAFMYATADPNEPNGIDGLGTEVWLNWDSPNGDYRELSCRLKYLISGQEDETTTLTIRGPDGPQYVDGYCIDWKHLAPDFGYVGYHNPASPPSLQLPVTWGPGLTKEAVDGEDDPHVSAAVRYKRQGTPPKSETVAKIDQVILEITEGFEVGMGTGIFANHPDYFEWREGQNKFSTMDGELTFSELSHGTRSVFAWVTQLMLGMAKHYGYEEQWEQRRGVFIIDEIDAHLHPSWQRRIIPTLQRHFPNVQIFASTHSPMMVAGLKAGQVHLLKRDETKRVVWSRNEQDIIGWSADEILRTMMGVADPTDNETASHAAELRQLRNEGPRPTPDQEEQRQARMRELRRSVDRDLLAGGPAAAQRELFERQFAEALEKYQESRQIGQENG